MLAYPQGRKGYDMINSGQGVVAAVEIVENFTRETIAKGLMPWAAPRSIVAPGGTVKVVDEVKDPGRFTALICSNVLRPPAETICIATSSSVTAASWPARSNLTPPRNHSAVITRATYGNGCRPTSK